jgi:uncharacterized repeat protein (TIGR02543 family)
MLCAALIAALLCGGVFETFAAETDATRAGKPGTGVEAIEALTYEPKAGAEYDGYIVKLDENAVATSVDETALTESAKEVVTDDMVVVKDPADVLAFAGPEAVEYIEPNYKLDTFAFPDDDPRDLMYNQSDYQWGIKYVGAKSAWLAGYDGDGVNIAIIDSGVVYGHEDLDQSKILDSFNFISDDGDGKNETGGYASDAHGANDKNVADNYMHGSMVTGVIAAETDNVDPESGQGVGIAGLADKAGLLIYKVIGNDGTGDNADVIKAYDRILKSDIRVDVINLSIGHTGYSRAEYDMIRQLNNKGVIIVASAGNNGSLAGRDRNAVSYPAGYDGVIGVGSIGAGGTVSSFSAKNASVDVAAPGESITGLSHLYKSGPPAYKQGEGTSFAAPIVAAAAVMFKQHDAGLNAQGFLKALRNSATEAGPNGYDTSYGYGILSLSALIEYINKAPQPDNPTPAAPAPANTNTAPTIQPPAGPPADDPPPALSSGEPGAYDSAAGNEMVPVADKKAVKRCKVTFAVNGGKSLAKSKRAKMVTSGKKYGKLPTPKRGGYKFKGWYTKHKGGARVNSSTIMKSNKNTLTLYARWKKK